MKSEKQKQKNNSKRAKRTQHRQKWGRLFLTALFYGGGGKQQEQQSDTMKKRGISAGHKQVVLTKPFMPAQRSETHRSYIVLIT